MALVKTWAAANASATELGCFDTSSCAVVMDEMFFTFQECESALTASGNVISEWLSVGRRIKIRRIGLHHI